MSSGGGYHAVDATTPGHVAPMPLVSTIQAVRYIRACCYLRSRVLMHSKIFMNIIILWVQPTVHAYCAWCPSISTACVVPWLFLTGLLSGQCLLWLTVSSVLGKVWGCVPPQGTLCQLWGLRWEGSTVADLQNFCLVSMDFTCSYISGVRDWIELSMCT